MTANISPDALVQAALEYAARGWGVLPVRGKVPLTAQGVRAATKNPETIQHWWRERWPSAGIAIALGQGSRGLVVVDVDNRAQLPKLEEMIGSSLPPTRQVRTARGIHLYFAAPRPIKTMKMLPGVELRGEGSYVVAPPSRHPDGGAYLLKVDGDPAPLPAALLTLCAEGNVANLQVKPGEKIHKGERNTRLTSLAGAMRRRGATKGAIEAALLAENRERCDPPLPEREVKRTAASISSYLPVPQASARAKGHGAAALAGAAPAEPSDSGKQERGSAATALVKLAQANAEFFHYGDDCFAAVQVAEHQENHSLRSRGFKRWLSKLYFEQGGRAAGGEALTSAITTLQGVAQFECEERDVFVRVADHGGKLYLDLCNERWQVVATDRDGWQVIESKDCPVRFRRAHGMLSLPVPERGGKADELRNFLNVASDDDFKLVLGCLIATYRPRGPYPVLILHGEQDTAKSTMTKVLRGLVDRNTAPLRSDPREPRDLMIAASNGWVCAFDNLSSLSPWLSDALCRLSTGGGFSTRALYTDDEERIFEAQRPVMLNGIEELATRGDLLDRSIIIYLPRIEETKRQPEEKFYAAYEAARPRLLGAMLDAVSAALRNIEKTKLDRLPRMADFAIWVTAAEAALGWEPGSFLLAYTANRRTANEVALESPVTETLMKLSLPWLGTATELLAALEPMIDERTRRSRNWPASGRTLSNALRRLAPNLRQVGIDVQFTRESRTGRRIITVSENVRDSSSPSSPLPPGSDVGDDGFPSSSDGGWAEESL